MRILTAKQLEDEDRNYMYSEYFMPEIDINKTNAKKLIKNISALNKDKEAEDIINKFGENIENLNTKNYTYKHFNEELGLDSLSRGETLMLVSYAAVISNEQIILKYDIKQLTKTSKRIYYNEFKDDNNIIILVDNEQQAEALEMIMRGEIK